MTAYQHLSQTPKHTIQASTQVKLLSWGSALCLKSACFLHLQTAACAELHSVDNIIKKKELWVQAWELPSFCPLLKMHKPLQLSKWGQYLRYSTSASLIPQNGIFCIPNFVSKSNPVLQPASKMCTIHLWRAAVPEPSTGSPCGFSPS